MAFDKSKPYGEIFGEAENGARYVQDGVYYNPAGEEVGRSEAAPVKPPKKAPAKAPAAAKIIGNAKLPQAEVLAENRRALAAEDADE